MNFILVNGETHTVSLNVKDLIETSHDGGQTVHKIRAEVTLRKPSVTVTGFPTRRLKNGKKLKRNYQFKNNELFTFNLLIMKKNLLYMLTAAAMLAGCAKNDVVDSEINKEGNLIGFSTYKNISRGNPVDDNNEFLKTTGNAF